MTTALRSSGAALPAKPAGVAARLTVLLDMLAPRTPRLLGRYAALLGTLLIAEILTSHHAHLRADYAHVVPVPASATAEAVVLLSGVALLRLARGLARSKRTEAALTRAVCAGVVLADVVRSPRHPLEMTLAAIMLVGLVAFRGRFTVAADPQGRRHGLRTGARTVAAGVVLGMGLTYLPGHVPASEPVTARLLEVLSSLVGLGGRVPIHGAHYADFVHATLLIVGVVAAASTLLSWVRPAEPDSSLAPVDEARLAALLRDHGRRDSLGYFALRRDKQVVWSASGKAAVTYRALDGVALVSGDPLGDPEAWPGALAAFRELADRHAWTPAVMGCSELGATVIARELGLRALELGDEAVVETQTFSLQGRSMRGVRQACGRIERAGYGVTVRRVRDLDTNEVCELVEAAGRWRGDAVERGFSMALSRIGDPADGDCVVVTARKEGRLAGLLHFVPWSTDGLSLDLMRRDHDADNGLNEYMISELIGACDGLGISRVSLNFAVFRDALARGERVGAGPVLRMWRRVLMIASRWYQIDSLYRFNDKFAPHWQPRYLCYPRARDVPRIALAALEAEAFVVRPRVVDAAFGPRRR